jgi:predicted alpha-1,2-mannosidase
MLVTHLLLLLGILASAFSVDDPASFVNPLAGSFTDGGSFSTGNTLPLVGYPWGFNHWAPQSRENSRGVGAWWWRGSEHRFTWLRCTHQPSPWIGDWAWFLFGPQMGGTSRDANRNPTYFWEPRAATIKPHYFDASLAPNNMRVELTPSMHGAMLRVTFPEQKDTKRICFTGQGAEWHQHGMSDSTDYKFKPGSSNNDFDEIISKPAANKPYIKGRANQVHIERLIVANFNMHVRIESDDAIDTEDHHDIQCFSYDSKATVVTVYIATSMLSEFQAMVNLNRELRYVTPDYSNDLKSAPSMDNRYSRNQFDIVFNHAHKTWNDLLGRVEVVDPGVISGSHTKQLSIFYTGLWRGLTFPRRTDEVDINGNVLHYSPYSPKGGIYRGPGVTDNGFWDTFRTVYPMLSLLYPDHLSEIVTGWLNAYREGGWLPSWASPGYRNCMVGTFADVVIADAIVKGIKGIDIEVAKGAIYKDSFNAPPSFAGNAIGKDGLDEYSSNGYIAQVPSNLGLECVSRSLDFGFADYAVKNAFLVIARKHTATLKDKNEILGWADTLNRRSNNVIEKLFDKSHGLFVPKSRGGGFVDRFDSYEWGKGFTEGNSWHHSFPPYAFSADKDGGLLGRLHGGRTKAIAKIHELLDTSGHFRPGSYGGEIHEMVEARAVAMGQYAHNNQPVHHILYLFALLGERKSTEKYVRFVMHHAYGEDFFAGDEDNGEQGSWYVLSALGLFATTPGTPDYVVGSPIFRHVRIHRSPKPMASPKISGNGAVGINQNEDDSVENYTDLVALGTSDADMHVTSITWNNEALPTDMYRRSESAPAVIHNSLLMKDGVLRFFMEGESTTIPFDRNFHGKSQEHTENVPKKSNNVESLKPIINNDNIILKEKNIEIKELKDQLNLAKNQVIVQKTVVSQLQEKLTNSGLNSQLNMTHLALAAANHHGLSEELLVEAVSLFRKVDHSNNDTVIYEHMLLVLLTIVVVIVLLIRYRLRATKATNADATATGTTHVASTTIASSHKINHRKPNITNEDDSSRSPRERAAKDRRRD